jgi:hypothetical protein
VRIYLATGPTDLRRSIDGFSALVREQLALDPLFCGGPRSVTRVWRRLRILSPNGSRATHILRRSFPLTGQTARSFRRKGHVGSLLPVSGCATADAAGSAWSRDRCDGQRSRAAGYARLSARRYLSLTARFSRYAMRSGGVRMHTIDHALVERSCASVHWRAAPCQWRILNRAANTP